MRLYYPRSFSGLLGAGLALIALPLVIALITSAVTVERLAARSRTAVYQAVQATQSGRRLAEAITALERSARQMAILGDRSLIDAYLANRQRFERAAGGFPSLPLDEEQSRALKDAVREEQNVYAVLSDPGASAEQLAAAVARFPALADHARLITTRAGELIDREVEALRATADRASRVTLWQLLAMLPIVVFLVTGFAILIARPIGQIDAAIRRLGGGDFNSPVAVGGPQDLVYLGERLEWMRQRLIDLEQQKNRFLREVSHELKTPLTAVREGAELLADEVGGRLSGQHREIAGILRQNSIELQRQIESLLQYGAGEFRRTPPRVEPVRVERVVHRVESDQRLALRAHDLKLDFSGESATISADAEMLRVMIDNLVSNAIKFSPRGGTVRVRAGRGEGGYTVDVMDDGPGVAEEDRDRLFEPFFQGRRSAAGAVRGTGVGLSIVREYAAAHGGCVEVVAAARGAHMRLTLPETEAA